MLLKKALCIVLPVSVLTACISVGSSNKAGNSEASFNQHMTLALQYLGRKNNDLARVHLKKAKQFNSSSAKAQLYGGYALLYQSEQDMGLAEQHYRKAIGSDQNNSMVRYNFAAFLYNQRRFIEALEHIEVASNDLEYARRPQAFYISGLIQRQLTLSAEALRSFVKVNQLLPEYAAPWLDTAEIHFEQKRFLEAAQALQQFSDLAQPTAQSLWLSVRLEKYFGNRDAVASQGLKLKKLFPYSSENREYKQWLQR